MFVLARLFEPFGYGSRSGIHYAIAFSFIFGTLGCHFVVTQPELASLDAPRVTIRVATSGDYTPFSHWPLGEAEPTGFSIEIARAYAVERGADLRWVRFRWRELTADLVAGSFDIALSGITVRPDRSAAGRFSLPLTTSGAIILVPEESALEAPTDLDRPVIRLAVNAGGHLERVARHLFPSATIQAVSENGKVVEALTQGRANAVMTDSLEAPHWQRITEARLRAIGPLTQDRKAAWFPPGRSDEAERFNRWLLRAESTGELDRIRAKFDLPPGRTANALPALLSSLDERLTLMNAVADAKVVLGVATENAQREEVVLDAASLGVREAAKEAGIKAPTAAKIHRFFRAQIEAAKWIQDRRREALRSTDRRLKAAGREDARVELDEVLRPALIYLGDRISMLLIASLDDSRHSSSSPAPSTSLTFTDISNALERHDLPNGSLREIHDALSAILRPEI